MSGPDMLILAIKIGAIGGVIDAVLRIALGIKEKPKVRKPHSCYDVAPWLNSIEREKEEKRRFFEKICK